MITSPEDAKKVKCTICERFTDSIPWIARDSIGKHIKSKAHLQNTVQDRIRVQIAAATCDENEAINSELEKIEIAPAEVRAARNSLATTSAAEQDMWDIYDVNGAVFTAGDDPELLLAKERTTLAHEADEFGLWNAQSMARQLGFSTEGEDPVFDEHDEDDAILCEMLDNARKSAADMVDTEMGTIQSKSNLEWYPYPTKMMFLLDTLDNLPRQRVSNSLMRVFLWILREGGARDVPSLDGLRKIQATLHKKGGVPTVPWTSNQGNAFYLNDLRVIIAKDYANPLTRANLHFYPEIPDGPINESWHGQKWRRELDRDALTPMIVRGHRHFYVDEIARCRGGKFVIPLRWVIYKGAMHADAFIVHVSDQGHATVDDSNEFLLPAADLTDNYFDLEYQKALPVSWSGERSLLCKFRTTNNYFVESYPMKMPNALREIAKGRPLYTSLVDLFFDDVSGNRSKSWNKHNNCYATHRNLPRHILQQEFHTHFVTTSPHASPSEQFEGIKDQIESTHREPVVVYDQDTQQEAAFRLFINTGPSDNPMASEMTGHIGSKGNYFCRKCKVGGCSLHKETDDGFNNMFTEGEPRTAEETLQELHKQIELACLGVAQAVKDIQTNTGVKDAYTSYWIEDLIRRSRELKKGDPNLDSAEIVKELMDWVAANESKIYNPFLSMKGFDAAKDTPIEILHTILLGIVKYAWHRTHSAWNPANKAIYTHRLQASNTLGLSIPAIRAGYIMQFANSLIGRQFKQVTQTCVFQMYDLVDELQYSAWKAMGELLPLLWYPEIDILDQYLVDVETATSNVLDIFAMIDPTKIITKNKLHIMTHTKTDILRHGPLVGVATEGFEGYNGVFRFCSIFSNHLAPSRDIAHQLAKQEGLKHRLTGGWWLDEIGQWVQAGSAVRDFLVARPILQALLGWTDPEPLKQGSVKLKPLKRMKGHPTQPRPKMALAAISPDAINHDSYSAESIWESCINVVSNSRDVCPVLSWVYATSPKSPILGRIDHILRSPGLSVVILDVFQVSEHRHEKYNLPRLFRRQDEKTLIIVPSTDIQFIFNVQHDCYTAKCTASGNRPKMQERMKSSIMESFIEHQPLDKYVINTTALHNAHLLRRCLPRSAWAPVPLFDTQQSRVAKHHELAEELRLTQSGKRAKRKDAAAASKPKKRKARKQATGKMKKSRTTKKAGGDTEDVDVDLDFDFELVNSSDSEQESDREPRDDESGEEMDVDDISEIYVARPTRRPRGKRDNQIP
ncbi:hypothetical protein FB451DRAFT_1053799 [Mycena latifolia]|nr:hypothetical protein FB451DRAFT_1053799 [Mycena latifolia]